METTSHETSSRVHDLGGLVGLGPINRTEHNWKYWEKQIDAIAYLLWDAGTMNVHSFRRWVESMTKEHYNNASYYEKWTYAVAQSLLEEKIITQQELDHKMSVELEEEKPIFAVGDLVQVKSENLLSRWRKPHLRTPGYLFGKQGIIERSCGVYTNPELAAFHCLSANQPMYRVRFNQMDVWPQYSGEKSDTIDVEVFQHWLEAPTTPTKIHSHKCGDDNHPHHHKESHHSHHEHEEHGHDHGDHQHEERAIVEQNAVDKEGDASPFETLANAVVSLLIEKKFMTEDQIRQKIENFDEIDQMEVSYGAKLVAKAWKDPEFKKLLLKDPVAAARSQDIDPGHIQLIAVENTEDVHNVIVCTLCSCYPRKLLGRPPDWYKSRSYRARAVIEPRKVLQEFGTIIPPQTKIRVHDSTADIRYFVVPEQPQETKDWSEEQLQKLLTRDSLIGAARIKSVEPK